MARIGIYMDKFPQEKGRRNGHMRKAKILRRISRIRKLRTGYFNAFFPFEKKSKRFLKGFKKIPKNFVRIIGKICIPSRLMKRAVTASLAAVIVIITVFYAFNPSKVFGQTYSLTQDDWSGGSSADTVNAPTNLTGWNKYSSSSGVTGADGSVSLTPSQSSLGETFTSTTYKDAGNTTANWNTSSGNLEVPTVPTATNSSTIADSLNGTCNTGDAGNYTSQIYDPVRNAIYFAGENFSFCKYDIASGIAANYAIVTGLSSITNFYNISAMAYDSANDKFYLGGSYGKFAVYAPGSPGTVTNLTVDSGLSAFWGTDWISAIVYDPDNGKIYLSGHNKLVEYTPGIPGTAVDLSTTSGFQTYFTANYSVFSMAYSPVNGKIYIGNGNTFAAYTPGDPGSVATSSALSNVWGGSSAYMAMAYNSANQKLYVAGLRSSNVKFAVYTPDGTATDLSTTSGLMNFWGATDIINNLAVDSAGANVYLAGDAGEFAVYAVGSPGTAADLRSATGFSSFWSTRKVTNVAFASVGGKVYLSGATGLFSEYTPGSPGTAADITAAANGIGLNNESPNVVAVDPATGLVYAGSNSGHFFRYDPVTEAVTDLTASTGLYSLWGTNSINGMAFDSSSGKLYIAGNTANFAVYTPGSPGTMVDLRYSSNLNTLWVGSSVMNLVFDPLQGIIYLAGYGKLASFDPDTGLVTDLSSSSGFATAFGSYSPNAMIYDSANHYIYVGGTAGRFVVYQPGSPGTAIDLRVDSGFLAFWSTSTVYSMVFNSSDNNIYIAGSGGNFAVYAPGSPGTATNRRVDSGLSAFWSTNVIYTIWFDSVSKIYIGGGSGNFAVYSTGSPGTATNIRVDSGLSAFWSTWVIYKMAGNPLNTKIYLLEQNSTKFASVSIPCSTCYGYSLTLDGTSQNIASATLTKNDTPGVGTVTYELSNDGGSHYAAVTPGSLYAFATVGSDLRFKITVTGNATVQDVTVAYNYNPTSGSLTSSKFDSADNSTIVNRLVWDEDASLPSGATVTISIRTADSSTNLTGDWTDFTNASANCSKVSTTVTCGPSALPAGMQDGSGDRWFQYKIALSSTGAATAAVSSASVQFVVNAAPEVRNVTASQNQDGTVTIHYEVRDTDTAAGSPGNQDHVTPMFEYWNGSTYETVTTLAAGDTDAKAVAHDGSWNNVTYTATWTPSADFPGHYQNNTAKIRVTANDGEGANPTGSAESATYTLDTLNPSSNSITVDASTTPATAHLSSTDDSAVTMKVSATDPTLASTPSEPLSATKAITLTEGATVYAKFTDAYQNSSNIISATLPATPTAVMIQDTSNVISDPHIYRLFLAWKAVAGSFASYRVHRSASISNPADWPEIGSPITSQSTNYYLDDGLNENDSYYYYVETVDSSENISFRSSIVNGIADGAQSGGEGGGGLGPAPIISSISHGTPKSTEVTITWDTDTLSNSVVGYSTSPSTFTSSVTVGSLVNNPSSVGEHSVVVTGLLPSTTYYYRVQSTDISSQTTTDDNGGVGYSFITPAGPIISNTSVEQTTNTTARVTWNTVASATTQLVHSVHSDMSEPTVTTGTSDPTALHIVNVTNLTPGTTYFFYVRSVDGNSSEATDKRVVDGVPQYYSFTTTNDATPPTISDVSVRLQPTSVDVIWSTNELADSQVEYGLTNAYGTSTTIDSTATTRHVVTITGLTPQTAYHYRIKTRDINSVLATGSDATFTTLPAGDATPPVISGVMVSSLSLNSASINWTTDEAATSYLDYGTTTALGSTFGNDTLTALHSVTLDALPGGATYYYRVRSVDAAGNSTTDNNSGNFYTFTTAADSTPPTVSVVDDVILMNSFRVLWSTNELADSQIEYGLDAGYGNTTTLDDSLVLDHAVIVSSLSAATAYHYRIKTRDSSGNLTAGSDRVVTTANQADNDPPVISVVSSSSVGRTTATVTWTTDEKAGSEVQYGPNLTYGYSVTNVNDNVQSHTVELGGLTPGTEYFFKVVSTDGSGNIASADDSGNGYTFTTIIDSDPPVVSGVIAALVADVSAVITWSTDEASTSRVIYGTTTAYGQESSVYPTLTTSHSITIQGLTKQTLYYYKVVSADAYTNSTTDDNSEQGYTFTTTDQPGIVARARAPEADKTPPTIQNLWVGSIGKTSAIVEWNTDEAADTILKYGTTIAYGTLAGSIDEKIMAHQVSLAGLTPGTIYHFIAVSTDASGNQGTSTDRVFATLNEDGTVVPLPPQPEGTVTEEPGAETGEQAEGPAETPAITNPILVSMNALKEIVDKLVADPTEQAGTDAFTQTINELANRVISPPSIVGIAPRVDVTGTTANIVWTTDKKASSAIAFSTDAEYDSGKSEPYPYLASTPGEFSTIHGVTLTNLEPATKYHFQVRSKGLVGGEAKSLDATFQTTSDLPVISDFKVAEVKDLEVALTWTTNVPTSTEIKFKNNATGVELTQGDTAFLRDHKFQLKNLVAGVAYIVVVNAQDEFENQTSSRPLIVSTSMDTTPPVISKVSSSSTLYPGKESRVQTIISWDTDEPATSHVYYQEGLSKDTPQIEVPLDTTPVKNHTVVVTKFRPMTVYKFHVESADIAGNLAKSNDFLILTPQQKASVLDIIISNFEQVFGWTKKLR
jgi:phosphodiesterase/alkaline phosphatase D-like protein